jgi:KipI family sensor histidine kinase inhibitor
MAHRATISMTPTPVGDTAVEILLGHDVRRVRGMAAAILDDLPPGVVDVVPALDRVTVVYDIGRIEAVHDLVARLEIIARSSAASGPAAEPQLHEIPVCYGGEHGPDLAEVCAARGIDRDGLVRLHTRPTYEVQVGGFVPGFAYLAGLPCELATPRRATPRPAVPAGSVGIGGDRTGVYPLAVPGGWNIIGRSPLRLFDPDRQPAAVLRAGDLVRFVEIGPTSFAAPAARPRQVDEAAALVAVVSPGLWTTIQDLGRPGHRAEGVPLSGAVDPPALRLANMLVGNPEGAAALECTLLGPELRFEHDALVAVAGADFPGLPPRRAVRIAAGSSIALGHARTGCRGYLAIAGGVAAPFEMGSRSTFVAAAFGGLAGRPLAAGDRLPVGPADRHSGSAVEPVAADHAVAAVGPARPGELRIIPAAEAGAIPRAVWEHEYRVSSRSDRMGVRLEGAPIPSPGDGIVSVPVLPGTVQIPPDGMPIVLLADAQTIGGYPVLGQVIAADLPSAGQLRPGDTVRWKRVTLEEAHQAYLAHEASFAAMRSAVAGRTPA